jgi:3-phenylpropionate/trans-cinnamate dioxygenase ferredoxin component
MSAGTVGEFVVVGRFDQFAPSTATRVEANGIGICVVRIEDDLYAIGDTCSHAEVSLAEGSVWDDECEIECWKHGASFSLRTGEPQSLPATLPVAVYAVRRDGDDVVVEVPEVKAS